MKKITSYKIKDAYLCARWWSNHIYSADIIATGPFGAKSMVFQCHDDVSDYSMFINVRMMLGISWCRERLWYSRSQILTSPFWKDRSCFFERKWCWSRNLSTAILYAEEPTTGKDLMLEIKGEKKGLRGWDGRWARADLMGCGVWGTRTRGQIPQVAIHKYRISTTSHRTLNWS